MNWMRGWWWLSRWVLVLWGDIIRNVVVGLLLSRLGETILGRVGSSVPLDHPHAKHAQDSLWRHLADEGSHARGQSVLALRGREILVQHQTLGRLAGRLIRIGETGPCEDHRTTSLRSEDGTLSIVPSRCSKPQLRVRLEAFGRALLGAFVETVGEGDKFPRLDPRKMTLHFSSSRLVWWFSFLLKMTLKACNIKNNNS
ncbi:hypothetical protein GOBAR_AA35401 [Gossypium barbadense]|uniref:Uncharacterized protein n=1 Tax=Gossypium barbadense TaxID=3634 RepID=A0A2P5W2H8_GOSBA|nr:hypothetical protein GOBAR_AA35401 [Gossypium barbadense]